MYSQFLAINQFNVINLIGKRRIQRQVKQLTTKCGILFGTVAIIPPRELKVNKGQNTITRDNGDFLLFRIKFVSIKNNHK